MAWETPADWSDEFFRASKLNPEVRDKQLHLFKRPRSILTYRSAGTLTDTTSWAVMDNLGLLVQLETTGRPVLVSMSLSLSRAGAAGANEATYFDMLCVETGLYASGSYTPKTRGAYYTSLFNTNQKMLAIPFFLFDGLAAGIYTFKPYWKSSVALSVNTNFNPIQLVAEEI